MDTMILLGIIWKYGAWTCFVVTNIWAFWKGGPTERIFAALSVTSWSVSFFITAPMDGKRPGLGTLGLECVCLVLLTWLAVYSRRPWVFFAAASNAVSVAILIVAQMLYLGSYGLITALGAFGSYGPSIALGFGVWDYQKQKKKAALENAASG